MRLIAAIVVGLVVILAKVSGVQCAEPTKEALPGAPTVTQGNSGAGPEYQSSKQYVPARTTTADSVRFGVAGNLLNYGARDSTDIAAWSPGGELFVAFPLARWTSMGARVGYQQLNARTINAYQLDPSTNGTMYGPWTDPPQRQLMLLGEWSAYAPLLNNRLELGGRLSVGWMKPYGRELSTGVEAIVSATAVYWFGNWFGGLSEISASQNVFTGPGADPGDTALAWTSLVSWKVGALARF